MAADPLIAVVDDDQSLRAALVRLVRSLGYEARGFASAEEFLEADTTPNFSCVITDIQMPGMNGIELTRVIAQGQSPIPVITITARTEPGLEESAFASGAMCFFRKPVDTNALVGCIERALKA